MQSIQKIVQGFSKKQLKVQKPNMNKTLKLLQVQIKKNSNKMK